MESTRGIDWLIDSPAKQQIRFVMSNPFLNQANANVHGKNNKFNTRIKTRTKYPGSSAERFGPGGIAGVHNQPASTVRQRIIAEIGMIMTCSLFFTHKHTDCPKHKRKLQNTWNKGHFLCPPPRFRVDLMDHPFGVRRMVEWDMPIFQKEKLHLYAGNRAQQSDSETIIHTLFKKIFFYGVPPANIHLAGTRGYPACSAQ